MPIGPHDLAPKPEDIAFRKWSDKQMDLICNMRFRPKRTWALRWVMSAQFRHSRVVVKVPAWLAVVLLVIGIDTR
jgi:hypothetical protein